MRIVRQLLRQHRRHRRRARRRDVKWRPLSPRLFALALYVLLALAAAYRFRRAAPSSAPRADDGAPATRAASASASASAARAMRPPQFDPHRPNHTLAHPAPPAHHFLHHDGVDDDDGDAAAAGAEADELGELSELRELRELSQLSQRAVRAQDEYAHSCVHSSATGDALCVHAPFCMRHSSLVYLSDSLRCEPFSERDGRVSSLSMSACVELQREVETRAEIEHVEHKNRQWVRELETRGNVLWFEGDTLLLRLGRRCLSISHFAERVFMLHHVLQHAQRYAMHAVSNVLLVADEQVANKLRYSKSWHHGLLAAVVFPNRVHYSLAKLRQQLSHPARDGAHVRVLVTSGLWQLAQRKQVPCFRRVALVTAMREQLLLSEERFPGVVARNASRSATRFDDARRFRAMLFRSLRYERAPALTRSIVYLQRSGTRRLSASGETLLHTLLQQVARESGFAYARVDVAGMSFAQQVRAVARAGVLVGVHGAQLLNCVFADARGALLELFPYRFWHARFARGCGGGLRYWSHALLRGDEFEGARRFGSAAECVARSARCRAWYRSDERELALSALDVGALRALAREAVAHVRRAL